MPWNAYGEVRGLNAPPRCLERLLAVLDRARPGDQTEPAVAEAAALDVDHRRIRRDLAPDELVRLEDRQHLLDPRIALQREQRELLSVADRADHGRLAAALNARLDPVLGEPGEDVLGLVRGRRGAHHDQQLGRSGNGHRQQ
jgi:hypothetical protein